MARSADTTVWSNIASTATCKGLGDACDGEVWHAVDSLCAWWVSAFVELRFCDAGMSSPASALVVCARGSARVARVHVSTQARTTVAAAVLLAIATYLCNGAAGVEQRGGAGLPGCAFPPRPRRTGACNASLEISRWLGGRERRYSTTSHAPVCTGQSSGGDAKPLNPSVGTPRTFYRA